MFTKLYVRVAIVLACVKQLHDHIIPLREVWANKTSLFRHFDRSACINLGKESERSCVCVFGVSILPLCTIYSIGL
jgi:hypothetical protein